MRWENIVDVNELTRTIDVLKPSHQLFEIRVLGSDKRRVLSGYFTSSAKLIEAFDTVDLRNTNIYMTLNEVNEALYSRSQHDKFVANTNTTSDTEIDKYQWLFIDLDPTRPTNVSSSDAELNLANDMRKKIKAFLENIGFHAPVEALSGNGYHLLYRIDLENNHENIQLVSDCLYTLSDLFSTKEVKIDVTNSNPSRICKLHGTLAQKGSNTEKRPHRMSKLLKIPEQMQVNSKDILMKLVEQLPTKESKSNKPNIQIKTEFDIKDWLFHHDFTYKEDVGRDCNIYLLDECPFDHNHKNGDSKIFAYSNGAIAFKCHHNSCAGKKWQDVRLKFEPNAYDLKVDDSRIEEGYKKLKQYKEENFDIPLGDSDIEKKPKKTKPKRKLKTAEALLDKDLPEPRVFVGVGEELPILVEGTCILSAKPKLGKSWWVLAMCLALANGDDFLGYKTRKCSTLYLDLETSEQLQQKRIKTVLGSGVKAPNNFYLDTETDNLDNGFVEQIENYLEQDPDIGVIVIDVFQIIRSKPKSVKESEYEHVYRDITPLNELAQRKHIAIILVCHDRKSVDPDDPFSNILGSTGLQGAATQMIVMFRRRKIDPIHMSIKGKTIDGLPDMDIELDKGQWKVVEGFNSQEKQQAEQIKEYYDSDIRRAVVELANKEGFKGRCRDLVSESVKLGIAITDDNKNIGGFLHRHLGRFLKEDGISVEVISNGTGPSIYRIEKRDGFIDVEDKDIPFF